MYTLEDKPMSIFGVDYSTSHPSIAALKAAKVHFVCRYIGSKDYTKSRSSKWLSPSEYKALKAAGIAVVVVFETTAKRAEGGRAAGVTDAKVAIKELAYCGLPSNTIVYFAVDYDTTVGPNITGYLQGAASVLGIKRVGVYAGYKVVKACFDKGLITWGWQTYAWSGGKWDKRAHIQQYSNGHKLGGASVDYDRAMTSNYGQSGDSSSTLATRPAPKPSGGTKREVSASDILKIAASYIGTTEHPPGSNRVPGITDWYGMTGSWCYMFISRVFDKAGTLSIVHGKQAYVPNCKGVFQPHGEWHTSNPQPGDLVCFDFNRSGEPEHIGLVEKVLSSTKIQTIEGNTPGRNGDGVYRKERNRSDVYGYARPAYGTATSGSATVTTEEDDFMIEYVSIDKTDKSRKQALEPGKWTHVYFDKNNSADSKKHHSEGDYPSVLWGARRYVGTISLRIKDLPKGTEGQIRCVYLDNSGKELAYCDIEEFVGSSGDTFVKTPVSGYVPSGQKMRVEVVTYGDPNANPKPTVIAGWVRLHAK
jgi:hypothetical protein